LRFWGLDIYQARLWVRPGFQAPDFARHTFALELDYLRNFTRTEIATRSIEEMRRISRFSDARAEEWQGALRAALPDVKKGDSITGLHLPGTGVRFLLNGKTLRRSARPRVCPAVLRHLAVARHLRTRAAPVPAGAGPAVTPDRPARHD
jgi:hypothetical protein